MKDNLARITAMRKGKAPSVLQTGIKARFARLTRNMGVGPKDITVFAQQLSTMINAGLPLAGALETIGEQTSNVKMQLIIREIEHDVKGGYSLFEALGKRRALFGDFFVHMCEVGETGGMLGPILERVATYHEKAGNLKRKVKTAMAYPSLIIVVAFGAVVFLMTTIIPTFSSLFAGFDAELPGPTRLVINFSNMLKEHFVLMLLGAGGLAFSGYRLWRKDTVRLMCDTLILRIPLIGTILKKNVIARFARSLGTLLTNGVTIVDALAITSRTVGNRAVEKVVTGMRDNVTGGQALIEPMRASGLFTPMTMQMVKVGEETGKLGSMLNKLADYYEAEVDASIDVLTSVIEPIIIIVLGIVLGGVLIAMYLPMFELMNVIQ